MPVYYTETFMPEESHMEIVTVQSKVQKKTTLLLVIINKITDDFKAKKKP